MRSMKLIDDIIKDLDDAEVKDIRVGINWTAVVSRYCGIARTYKMPYCSRIDNTGELTSYSALELAELAKSWNLMEASIGVAAINSLIKPRGREINIFDFIYKKIKEEKQKTCKVAIIGHFPDRNVKKLRDVADVWIFERNPSDNEFIDTAEDYLLPEADIVLITGTALINKSLPRLLELSKNSYTAIIGPSTPMSDVLFDYDVDLLAGSEVINTERVLKKISEGAHLFDLKPDLKFLIMK
ncbi:MAG: hypothetical protein DRO92_02940 [Candidatus Altiarchaeales archaeon]|nr:MAG: hypothetical protein DRO92_02940 [Candidatus Altiarchaeales archaeon]